MVGGEKRKSALDKEDKGDNKITIGVHGQDGIKVLFSIKRDLPLKKLLMKYCENKKLDYQSTKFIYKRRRVLVRQTPDELHMKGGAQIDAMVDGHAG